MKKLVLTALVSSIFAGALFANNGHMMDKQECFKMHKKFHSSKTVEVSKSTISQDTLNAFYPEEDID